MCIVVRMVFVALLGSARVAVFIAGWQERRDMERHPKIPRTALLLLCRTDAGTEEDLKVNECRDPL